MSYVLYSTDKLEFECIKLITIKRWLRQLICLYGKGFDAKQPKIVTLIPEMDVLLFLIVLHPPLLLVFLRPLLRS